VTRPAPRLASSPASPVADPAARSEIVRLDADGLAAHCGGLGALLVDAVQGGASVGFLAGLDGAEAADWWREHTGTVADGTRLLWTAVMDTRVLGTVSLVLEGKDNGRHRAEIAKLMVHRDARGQGLARRLLDTAEHAARAAGVTLLLLDTQTDSAAEHLYRSTGWTSFGVVPAHAAQPDGTLAATTFFFKPLT